MQQKHEILRNAAKRRDNARVLQADHCLKGQAMPQGPRQERQLRSARCSLALHDPYRANRNNVRAVHGFILTSVISEVPMGKLTRVSSAQNAE